MSCCCWWGERVCGNRSPYYVAKIIQYAKKYYSICCVMYRKLRFSFLTYFCCWNVAQLTNEILFFLWLSSNLNQFCCPISWPLLFFASCYEGCGIIWYKARQTNSRKRFTQKLKECSVKNGYKGLFFYHHQRSSQ